MSREDLKVLIYHAPEEGFEADANGVAAFFHGAMFPDRDPETVQGIQVEPLDGTVTQDSIKRQISDISVTPNVTGIVVYFSCHGAVDERTQTQLLELSLGRSLKVGDLHQWVSERGPRFGLIMCDACSTYLSQTGAAFGSYGTSISRFDDLFLKPRGKIYTLTAASPGEIAWADSVGGCFTKALLNELQKPRRRKLTWQKLHPRLVATTQREFVSLKDRFKDTDLSEVIDERSRDDLIKLRTSTSQEPTLKVAKIP